MQINLHDRTSLFTVLIEESKMPIGLYVGEELIVEVANKAILNAWGKDESVIGIPLRKALPELENQPFFKILKDVFTIGIAYEAKEDKVQLLVDGVLQTFYFDFIYKPLKDENGNVWAVLNNATDVTELVNAKLKCEESEQLFRQMIYDAPIAIGILRGKELIVEDANDDLLKIWGKNKSILGLKITDALPEIKDQPFPELLNNVYSTGTAHYGYETLAKLEHNGVLVDCYFNFVYDPIMDKEQQVTGILIVANEVTLQVKSRLAFMESDERFRNLLLDTPLATAYYETEDMVISIVNDEMLKFWGKDKSVIGLPFEEAIPELKGQPFINLLKEVYRTGIPYHADQQMALLPVNGELKQQWFNFTYKPLRNAEGKVYAILHAATDVTNLVQLQKQKDEFLGIASHELKTPVTSIKAYTQVLERMIRKDGDEKKANMVHKMDIQLNRLTGLIGDLLDVTKIQSGKMAFNPVQFDFDNLVSEIIDEIQHTTSQHQIKFELKSNASVYADKERIGQVITNFLSNAIKYSNDAESIDVESYVADQEVILSVRDYGIGISQIYSTSYSISFIVSGVNFNILTPV